MIKPIGNYVMCRIVRAETIKEGDDRFRGIEYVEQFDPRIRVADVEMFNEEFGVSVGTRVFIPMGYGIEFSLRGIEYVFVKPEAIVGYE